ncbi:MAG: hypothetical protein GDA41_09615 [Rhodospirillales bacterium]|nr:hypothetical protein [Rhodospirillales bacterium]
MADSKDERAQRQAAALRQNLLRRKAQDRRRKAEHEEQGASKQGDAQPIAADRGLSGIPRKV